MAGLAVAAAVGCYDPAPKVGAPCPSGVCPSGQHCDMTVRPAVCAAADARPVDAPPDAPPTCATAGDCTATAPVCDPTTSTCRGCISDADCANGGGDVCLEYAGSCHNGNNALYIAPSGTGTACTKTSPCTFATSLGQVANNARIIVVLDGTYTTQFTIPNSYNANSLSISGTDRDPASAVITPATNAGILVETSAKDLVIEGITVSGGPGSGVDNRGVLTLSHVALSGNAQLGVVTSGTSLKIWDSVIKANMTRGVDATNTAIEILRTQVIQNFSGGLDISSSGYTIESSIIADNGTALSNIGGLQLSNVAGKTPQVFAFNTVANNQSSGTIPDGVSCDSALTLDSSIFTDAVGPMCATPFSVTMGTDPLFVSTTDYHITPTSPAREMANPAATNTRDIDGEPRPQGGGRDIGADEIP